MSDEDEGARGLDALWEHAREAWQDDKRHAALLEYALAKEQLPELAGRYRALEGDPEQGAIAKRQIERIVTAATMIMLSQKTPPPPRTNKILTFVVVVLTAAVFSWLAWVLAHVRR